MTEQKDATYVASFAFATIVNSIMEELSTRIGLRSDTLENWTAANPILLDGEVAVVFDGEN